MIINLKSRRYLILYFVILFAAFMRLCDSPQSSLWTDEFATYWVSSAPTLSECIARATPTQGQSPFFYVLEWGVLQIFTHDEFSLRLLSLASSLISVALIFFLALLIFGKYSPFSEPDANDDNSKSDIESDAFFPAIFAALMFAISESAIYYAQEARPYALAVMFALLSQIFFFALLRRSSKRNIVLYIIASSLICYTHYIFGTLLLTQNLWMLYLFLKSGRERVQEIHVKSKKDRVLELFKLKAGDISFGGWCILQLSLIATLLPLLFHLMPILKNGDKWNWVPKGGLWDMVKLFNDMIDLKFIFFALSLFLFLLTMKNFIFLWRPAINSQPSSGCYSGFSSSRYQHIFSFLILWLATPLLFAYFATECLNSSLMDQRYLILIFIPYFLLGSLATAMLRSKIAKSIFTTLMVIFYFVQTLIPNFLNSAHFTPRISHNWRYALHSLKMNLRPDDSILLRSGFIKENWIPTTQNEIIKEYVQAPLKSFYFTEVKGGHDPKAVYNLTFSPLRKFEPYYRKISAMAAKSDRVWIIGIKQPNNFPLENIPGLLFDTHKMVSHRDFDGVFLILMIRK